MIDINTKIIGNIKSLSDAKKKCKKLVNHLPSCGYEVIIDTGLVKLNYTPTNSYHSPFTFKRDDKYGIPRKYHTYLQNNANGFRVWSWIGQ